MSGITNVLKKCLKCGFQHYLLDPCPPLGSADGRVDPVVEAVRADLHRRSQLGLAKYGTSLADNPGAHRAKLQHAYEEALDLANYLKWSIMELDRMAVRGGYTPTTVRDQLVGITPDEATMGMPPRTPKIYGHEVDCYCPGCRPHPLA